MGITSGILWVLPLGSYGYYLWDPMDITSGSYGYYLWDPMGITSGSYGHYLYGYYSPLASQR